MLTAMKKNGSENNLIFSLGRATYAVAPSANNQKYVNCDYINGTSQNTNFENEFVKSRAITTTPNIANPTYGLTIKKDGLKLYRNGVLVEYTTNKEIVEGWGNPFVYLLTY